MIKSKIKVFSGLLLLFFGFAIIFTSLSGMTGFAISNDLSTSLNAILGLIPIAAGLIILFFGREGDDRMRGRDSLRHHNEEAHYTMRERYKSEHGRYPSAQELKKYMRGPHESGELRNMMNDEE